MAGLVAELAPTGIVTVWPLLSVTTNGVPVTAWLTATVYVSVLPSAIVVADGVTVTTVWSASSVTVVVAVEVFVTASKLPPVRPVTVTFRVSVPWT
nr:hypothetical protein [Rhizobacter sp. Root1221]